MNGWLDLGSAATFLHQRDGLLWVEPIMDRALAVLDLAHGRVVGRPLEASTRPCERPLPFGGGLLVQQGEQACALGIDGVRWRRRGMLLDASETHALVLVGRDAMEVVDVEGTVVATLPPGLPLETLEPEGGLWRVAIAGDRIATVDLDTLVIRDLSGSELERRELDGAGFVKGLGAEVIVVEHLPGVRTRMTGALEAELAGHVQDLAGRPDHWVASVAYPNGRSEAVFCVQGRLETSAGGGTPMADAQTLLVAHNRECTWYAGDRVRRLELGEGFHWGQWTLWDGMIVAQRETVLLPVHAGPIGRWKVAERLHRSTGG